MHGLDASSGLDQANSAQCQQQRTIFATCWTAAHAARTDDSEANDFTSTAPKLVASEGLQKSNLHAAQPVEAKLDIKRMASQAHLLTKLSRKLQPQHGLARVLPGMQGRLLDSAKPVRGRAVASAPWLIPAARCRELFEISEMYTLGCNEQTASIAAMGRAQ
eukprot:s106_g15.t1